MSLNAQIIRKKNQNRTFPAHCSPLSLCLFSQSMDTSINKYPTVTWPLTSLNKTVKLSLDTDILHKQHPVSQNLEHQFQQHTLESAHNKTAQHKVLVLGERHKYCVPFEKILSGYRRCISTDAVVIRGDFFYFFKIGMNIYIPFLKGRICTESFSPEWFK